MCTAFTLPSHPSALCMFPLRCDIIHEETNRLLSFCEWQTFPITTNFLATKFWVKPKTMWLSAWRLDCKMLWTVFANSEFFQAPTSILNGLILPVINSSRGPFCLRVRDFDISYERIRWPAISRNQNNGGLRGEKFRVRVVICVVYLPCHTCRRCQKVEKRLGCLWQKVTATYFRIIRETKLFWCGTLTESVIFIRLKLLAKVAEFEGLFKHT